jgi:hypothetical protein
LKRLSEKEISEYQAKYQRLNCTHNDGLYWYLSPHDERGWMCVTCFWRPGEEPGYSPQHDRDLLDVKVNCILMDLADEGLLSVSNGSEGDGLVARASRIARDERTLDQESIVAILAKLCAGDGEFWRKQHESILAGDDQRRRCACGKLAHIFCGAAAYCSFACEPKRDEPW